VLHVFDLIGRKLVETIDLRPNIAPHTVRRGPDGLVYITCENTATIAVIDPASNTVIDAIDSGSTNGHRLCIPDDGKRLYTDNEEDATVSVIDLPARKLVGKIGTPEKLAGIAVSGDGKTVVAVSDDSPVVFLIDTASEKIATLPLQGVPKAAQIVRYSPDGKLLVVSSLNSNMLSLIEVASGQQAAIPVGNQPMDFAFRGDEIFVGCQGDGSMHVIDVPNRRHKTSFPCGTGCESVGFF
jgi:DNA-binding beta-propeller fold protein YncE